MVLYCCCCPFIKWICGQNDLTKENTKALWERISAVQEISNGNDIQATGFIIILSQWKPKFHSLNLLKGKTGNKRCLHVISFLAFSSFLIRISHGTRGLWVGTAFFVLFTFGCRLFFLYFWQCCHFSRKLPLKLTSRIFIRLVCTWIVLVCTYTTPLGSVRGLYLSSKLAALKPWKCAIWEVSDWTPRGHSLRRLPTLIFSPALCQVIKP